MKQTAVEWLIDKMKLSLGDEFKYVIGFFKQAKEMEKQKQDEFAIGFAEWYEEEILAKGNFNMIEKPKKQLLEIYKKEKGL